MWTRDQESRDEGDRSGMDENTERLIFESVRTKVDFKLSF